MDLTLRTYPDRILQNMCRPLFCKDQFVPCDQVPNLAILAELAQTMGELLVPWKAVGLAAPQVGYGVRLITVAWSNRPADFLRLCDPRIVDHSEATGVYQEGCLSLPWTCGEEGTPIDVERWLWVDVRYHRLDGSRSQIRAQGFAARVLQHEIDHLNGWLLNATELMRQAARKQVP